MREPGPPPRAWRPKLPPGSSLPYIGTVSVATLQLLMPRRPSSVQLAARRRPYFRSLLA
jgi:hypothetical protein